MDIDFNNLSIFILEWMSTDEQCEETDDGIVQLVNNGKNVPEQQL
ncbi:hypothetical protein AVEN_144419-1, partial [Araneus ventricosus]